MRVKKKHAYSIQKEWNAGDYALLHVVSLKNCSLPAKKYQLILCEKTSQTQE